MPVPAYSPGYLPAPTSPKPELGLFAAVVVALSACLIVGGLVVSAAWVNRPGAAIAGPSTWPSASQFRRSDRESTLLVFAHPHCPCTVATLRELEKIVSRCRDRMDARVVFCSPKGAPEGWEDGDLWQRAEALPDVTVVRDLDGVEARRFGARTSGTTFLFDTTGTLRFAGGITGSRGHEGDNAGRSEILAFVLDGETESDSAPAFGCPLFDEEPATDAQAAGEPSP